MIHMNAKHLFSARWQNSFDGSLQQGIFIIRKALTSLGRTLQNRKDSLLLLLSKRSLLAILAILCIYGL